MLVGCYWISTGNDGSQVGIFHTTKRQGCSTDNLTKQQENTINKQQTTQQTQTIAPKTPCTETTTQNKQKPNISKAPPKETPKISRTNHKETISKSHKQTTKTSRIENNPHPAAERPHWRALPHVPFAVASSSESSSGEAIFALTLVECWLVVDVSVYINGFCGV